MKGSWAVSFGMPSMDSEFWRKDVEETRRRLRKDKLLSVSVVATPEPDWTLDRVAEDFVRCARWAAESGADCVEANFSCPNVASLDAQLYQSPRQARRVAQALRKVLGSIPLLIKIGPVSSHVPGETAATPNSNERDPVSELLSHLAGVVDALVMVNCFPAQVETAPGILAFQGESRGIAGDAIRNPTLDQVREFIRGIRLTPPQSTSNAKTKTPSKTKLKIVGVGGISNAKDVQAHLSEGSHAVQLATQAMRRPSSGLEIRKGINRMGRDA
jgi:dihydroorotate dehydrogenase